MKIKTTTKYHLVHTGHLKKEKIISIGKDIEKMEALCTISGNVE